MIYSPFFFLRIVLFWTRGHNNSMHGSTKVKQKQNKANKVKLNSNHFFGTCNKLLYALQWKKKNPNCVRSKTIFLNLGCGLSLNNVDSTILSVIYATCMKPLSCNLIRSLLCFRLLQKSQLSTQCNRVIRWAKANINVIFQSSMEQFLLKL